MQMRDLFDTEPSVYTFTIQIVFKYVAKNLTEPIIFSFTDTNDVYGLRLVIKADDKL